MGTSLRAGCAAVSLWLWVLGASAQAASTQPDLSQPDCDFARQPGRAFQFSTADPVLQGYGFVLWKSAPSLASNPLDYDRFAGRHGKLTGKVIRNHGVRWYQGIMDDCSAVYAEDASLNSQFDGIEHLEFNGKIIFADQRAAAEALIGDEVVVQGEELEPRQRLYTRTRGRYYPLRDGDRLKVVGIDTHRYAFAKGVGPFFLEVERAPGQRGLIKFNPFYLRAATGPLPRRAEPPNPFADFFRDYAAAPDSGLQTSAVQLPEPPPVQVLAPEDGYVLNVATMHSEANGLAAVYDLEQAGYSARLVPQEIEQRLVYRVQITGFPSLDELRLTQQDIASQFGWQDGWVTGE